MATLNFIEKYSTIRNLGLHNHSYWEIIYVISGSGTFKFSDLNDISYKAGDMICIPPEIYHSNAPRKGFQNINLTLCNWQPKFQTPKLFSDLTNKDLNYINDLSYIRDITYRQFRSLNRNNEILASLTDLIVKYIDSLTAGKKISTTSKLIESNIISGFSNTDFNLNAVYEKLPYAKRYLQKLFIKEYGISPSQFLMQTRIDYAANFLSQHVDNDFSINEIAEKCGFSDQFYFSRVFKKMMGVSPTQYKSRSQTQ